MRSDDPLELAKALAGYREDERHEGPMRRAERESLVRALPAWPFVVPFAGFLVAWAMGLGLLLWPLVALAMVLTWAGITKFELPEGSALWGLFVGWACVTLVMNDTPGRLIGALVRLTIYICAGIIFLHLHNATQRITLHVITATMTWFLVAMTIGGLLGILWPTLSFKTPMALIIPRSLWGNDVIHEMIERRATQWDPSNSWRIEPRPSAPFTYTNQWGNAYSLILPIVMLNILVARQLWRRIATVLVVAASAVPAAATQNRGMIIGLAIVLLWVAFQLLRRGRVLPVLGGAVILGSIIAGWFASPASGALFRRLEFSASTSDRHDLYILTIESALESPLLGWGSPRPAPVAWLPSLGTQGQFWLVLQSHGFVGLALFMSFFAYVFARSFNRTDIVGAVAGGVILATMVETLYYGMSSGLALVMIAAALISRSAQNRLDESEPIPGAQRIVRPVRAEWRVKKRIGGDDRRRAQAVRQN